MEARVERSESMQHDELSTARSRRHADSASVTGDDSFHDAFVALFDTHFQRIYRFLDRLSGAPDLAADLAQETFIRLYRRGSVPDAPEAWLITVALNLFRNVKTMDARRNRLLTDARVQAVLADPPAAPDQDVNASHDRRRVRIAIDRLSGRDKQLLLLRAEGYGYREIARALDLNEASIGTLLARAKSAFRHACQDVHDAP
jgi:RNA polymerase sigma-70 factor (ECF subfamily)